MERTEAGQAYLGLYIDSGPLTRQAEALRGRLESVFDAVGAVSARRFTARTEPLRRAMEQWERQSERLRGSFAALGQTMGQALAMAMTPAVTAVNGFLSAVLRAARTFRSFIYSLFGKKTAQAGDDMADTLADVGDSAGSAGKRIAGAAREARRALMAFDQIHRLDDDTESGAASGGGGGLDVGDLWDGTEELIGTNPFGELLRRLIDEGDYAGAGAALAAKLGQIVDALDAKITNPAFQNRLKNALSGITSGINGFFEGMTFREDGKQTVAERLGDFVGDAVGLGLDSLHILLSGIEWSTVGETIAQFVNGGVESLRRQESNLGTVLADWINVKIGTLSGLFANLDWSAIGGYIADNINSAFAGIDWRTAAKTLVDGVRGMAQMIGTTLKGIQWAEIISDISSAIFAAIFGEEGEQWLREHPFWSKLMFGSDTPYTPDSGGGDSGTRVNEDNLIPGVTYTHEVPDTGDQNTGFFGSLAGKLTSWLSGDGKVSVTAEVTDVTDQVPAEKKEFSHFSGKVETAKDEIPAEKKTVGGMTAGFSLRTLGEKVTAAVNGNTMGFSERTLGDKVKAALTGRTMGFSERTLGDKVKADLNDRTMGFSKRTLGEKVRAALNDRTMGFSKRTLGEKVRAALNDRTMGFSKRTLGSDVTKAVDTTAKFTSYTEGWTYKPEIKVHAKVTSIETPADAVIKPGGTYYTKALGGAFFGGAWHDIPQYAGGTANAGSLFIAGEAGPEVVGHIGGRTEVLNKSQLAAAMHSAVISGMGESLRSLAARITPPLAVIGRSVSRSEEHLAAMDSRLQRGGAGDGTEITGLLRQIVTLLRELDTNAYLDGDDVTDQVVKRLNARTRATGVCELIV